MVTTTQAACIDWLKSEYAKQYKQAPTAKQNVLFEALIPNAVFGQQTVELQIERRFLSRLQHLKVVSFDQIQEIWRVSGLVDCLDENVDIQTRNIEQYSKQKTEHRNQDRLKQRWKDEFEHVQIAGQNWPLCRTNEIFVQDILRLRRFLGIADLNPVLLSLRNDLKTGHLLDEADRMDVYKVLTWLVCDEDRLAAVVETTQLHNTSFPLNFVLPYLKASIEEYPNIPLTLRGGILKLEDFLNSDLDNSESTRDASSEAPLSLEQKLAKIEKQNYRDAVKARLTTDDSWPSICKTFDVSRNTIMRAAAAVGIVLPDRTKKRKP